MDDPMFAALPDWGDPETQNRFLVEHWTAGLSQDAIIVALKRPGILMVPVCAVAPN